MSFRFEPRSGPIIVEASLSGPRGQTDLRLVLDTGATTSVVRTTHLIAVGYDPDASTERFKVTMGNGEVSTAVDGLLGLDFFRGLKLTLDFRSGQIELE